MGLALTPNPYYQPILRAKQGEIEALGHLSPRAQARIRPLLDIPLQTDKDKRSLPQYLCEKVTKLRSAWGTKYPIQLDMSRYAPDIEIGGGQHPVERLFEYAKQCNLNAIPVTGPLIDRGPEPNYLNAVRKIAQLHQRGVAVRIRYADLAEPGKLNQTLDGLSKLIDVAGSDCDVILDLEAMERLPKDVLADNRLLETVKLAVGALKNKSYRSLTICASSIPAAVGKQYNVEPCRTTRVELGIWRELISDESLPRILFGDYGIVSPFQSDGGAPVQPPSRIRLSTETEHVLYRSSPNSYRQLRATVVREDAANMQATSWGKRAIFGRGHGFTGVGNPTDWVARDINAHMETTFRVVERQMRISQRIPAQRRGEIASFPWLQEGLDFPEEKGRIRP